ncbi:TIGR03643 family protein [Larkinella punicea]|uniref:TIGR03643 family protein n=1 Tax=Larkinella punicea TaxID=2315727 RepID=A0A368JGP4_9BACT|nr:TIGR03643 family protein [Larkinella punicea]RCR66702.1 TIGR03643 family protein [Larkinella punicea]
MKRSKPVLELGETDLDRIVEMAWEDRTPFDAIEAQFGLSEQEVIEVMRRQLKPSSWRKWRERVQGRATKHAALSAVEDARFKSNQQRTVTHNRISKTMRYNPSDFKKPSR